MAIAPRGRAAGVLRMFGCLGGRVALGEAFDFAVTSALRADCFWSAINSPSAVFERYEEFKRSYKQTAAGCAAAGFRFVPFVVEAHAGAMSAGARGLLDWVARQAAAAQHLEAHTVSLRIAQRLSCSLHRENARAVLRRTTVQDPPAQPQGWDMPGGTWQ